MVILKVQQQDNPSNDHMIPHDVCICKCIIIMYIHNLSAILWHFVEKHCYELEILKLNSPKMSLF